MSTRKGDGVDTCKHCGSSDLWGNHFLPNGDGDSGGSTPGAVWDVLCESCGKFQIRRNTKRNSGQSLADDDNNHPDYAWEAEYRTHSSSITGIFEEM